jgi:hypothetical protein
MPLPVPELGRGRGTDRDGECLEMEKEPDGPELIIGSTRDRREIKVGMWIGEDSSFTTARGQENKCTIN